MVRMKLFVTVAFWTVLPLLPLLLWQIPASGHKGRGDAVQGQIIALSGAVPGSGLGNHQSVRLGRDLYAERSPKFADRKEMMDFKGYSRAYVLHLPPSYVGSSGVPLVVCLHGGGGDMNFAIKMTGLNAKADSEGFAVVYPNGTGRLRRHFLTWNAFDCCGWARGKQIDDVGFIRALLARLEGELKIDAQRIYLVGFSNGAMMSYRLASELSDKFAAFAAVAGSMSGKEREPDNPVSALIIHGRQDRHVPYDGGTGKLAKWGFPVNPRPVSYAVDFWVKADCCSPVPLVRQEGSVTCKTYSGGKDGCEVRLYAIEGARHAWPGGKRAWLLADCPSQALGATDRCWEFFARHSKSSSQGRR